MNKQTQVCTTAFPLTPCNPIPRWVTDAHNSRQQTDRKTIYHQLLLAVLKIRLQHTDCLQALCSCHQNIKPSEIWKSSKNLGHIFEKTRCFNKNRKLGSFFDFNYLHSLFILHLKSFTAINFIHQDLIILSLILSGNGSCRTSRRPCPSNFQI